MTTPRRIPTRTAAIGALVAATVLALAALAAGETVYMRNGKKYVGKVTRQNGTIKVEMAYGTITVDADDVIYISKDGARTKPATPAAPPDEYRPPSIQIRPSVQWNQSQATLPEPILFMMARRIELLSGMGVTEGTRQELEQWRRAVHDQKRKCRGKWLTREVQEHRRKVFKERAREANEKARRAARLRARTAAQKARKRKLAAQAKDELLSASRVWPDDLIGVFLTACVELHYGEYRRAEARFHRCIQGAPLVAALHQGRALALLGLKEPLQALEEFCLCLRLRDDTYDTVELVKRAMKEVPGGSTKDPIYTRAQELLDRYEKPKYPRRSYDRGINWLMPGKPWSTRNYALVTPPYDRIVARGALAVPVSEDGVLVVDKNAIAGAKLIYVEVSPDHFARALPSRSLSYRSGTDKLDVPLAPIAVRGVTFTPVRLGAPAALKGRGRVTIRAANVYRRMGTGIRTGELTASPDGSMDWSAALLPGEAVGVAFAGKDFAAFITARDDPETSDGGKSKLVKPADLKAWAKKMERYLKRRSSFRWSRGPALKKDAPRLAAVGQVFLVHILAGQKLPPKLLK